MFIYPVMLKDKILATSSETSKVENAPAKMLRDLDQQMEKRADAGCTLWIKLYSVVSIRAIRVLPFEALYGRSVELSRRTGYAKSVTSEGVISLSEEKGKGSLGVVVEVFLFDELRDRVVNDIVTQLKFLTSLLDDGRGSGYVRFDNQSIECDRLIGIGFVLDFIEFISFTFSDKEMILVIEAICASVCGSCKAISCLISLDLKACTFPSLLALILDTISLRQLHYSSAFNGMRLDYVISSFGVVNFWPGHLSKPIRIDDIPVLSYIKKPHSWH
ncbi:hypothetical protein Tco_0531508 [Tanacetum coccineum]